MSTYNCFFSDNKMNKFLVYLLLFTMFGQEHSFTVPQLSTSTVGEMIKESGYALEELTIKTPDGYLLPIQRIPGGKHVNKIRTLPPVLLVHGLGGSSSDFTIMGPKRSLAYLLADAGYDVFLGNMRFNTRASHVNISRDDPTYWNFSIDEHGQFDIPSMMEEVLKVTGAPGLHYVGYSMGSTSYMMACAHRPDLAAKVVSYVGLAPAVHMDNLQPIAKLAFRWNVPKLLRGKGINYLSLGGRYQRALASGLCSPRMPSEDVCMALIFLFIGEDYDQIEWDVIPVVISRFQPVSVKQLEHYGQLSLTDKLTYFDYGAQKNMEKYGSMKPPIYNIKANKAPVALFYGNNDLLTPPREIKDLANLYRKTNITVVTKQVPWKKFNHYDFIVAKDLPTLVNNDIIHFLNTNTMKPTHKYNKARNKYKIYNRSKATN